MSEARTHVRIIYACVLVVFATILFLMIYTETLDAVGEALFEIAKEIAKFFLG